MHHTRRFSLPGLIALFLSLAPAVHAYEKDTHYVLTYYLARRCGYTATQAQAIASADVSIDLEDSTEPFQIKKVVVPWSEAQPIRIKFHAFPDSTRKEYPFIVNEDDEKLATTLRDARLAALWKQAIEIGNPGIYLHFMQDTYAHRGFWSRAGHTTAGNAQDFLAEDADTARAMVAATIKFLGKFMKDFLERDPCEPDEAEVAMVLTRLINASPTPAIPPNYDPGLLGFGVPDLAGAGAIVNEVLHETMPGWRQYPFNALGVPTANMKLERATLAELFQGGWLRTDELDPKKLAHIRYKPQEGTPDEFEFEEKHAWLHGTYDEATQELQFTRKPTKEELLTFLPEWVVAKAGGQVEWHLFLKLDCCRLTGRFYPGLVKWKDNPDEEKRVAFVPQGKDGWGDPREFEYRTAGRR